MSLPPAKRRIADIRAHMTALPAGFSGDTIKLCSNESAFGPAPGVIDVAEKALHRVQFYAEQGTGALQQAIAGREDIDPDRIVCGPGSDELLARLCRAYLGTGDELLYSVNGYAKFGNYALANDAVPVPVPDADFRVSVDNLLARVTPRTRMVMVANPDNPTGTWLPHSEIARLHKGLPESVLLVVDSAYAEYVDDPCYRVPSALVDDHDNVVMTRTFSKIHGLAGLRLGWLYGPSGIVETIQRIGTTFPISNIALDCGVAAMANGEYQAEIKQRNQALRTGLQDGMRALGLDPVESQTNFVLIGFPAAGPGAAGAAEALWMRNVMVRRFPTPALADHIRVSIGTEEEMALFHSIMSTYLGESC